MDTDSQAQIPKPLKARKGGASHSRTIVALMLREMASRYGRTPGGYIWALLEPLGMIVILSIGFSLLLRSPPLGSSFIMFYATGHLLYSLFLQTNKVTMSSLRYSRSLLSYPVVSWIDAVLARIILNSLTQLLVSCVLLVGVMLYSGHQSQLNFVWILTAFTLAILLGAGVGLVNCVLTSFFPMWKNIWAIITRPLFLASGIIWIYEELPQGAQTVLWWNPLVHITGISRMGFFSIYEPTHISVNLVLIPSLVCIAIGLLILRRFHLWILNAR